MSRDPEIRRMARCAACEHPSSKCSLCGKYSDLIAGEERARIAVLERQVETLAAVLISLGYERVDIGFGVVECRTEQPVHPQYRDPNVDREA